jgi:hypothetical protein
MKWAMAVRLHGAVDGGALTTVLAKRLKTA